MTAPVDICEGVYGNEDTGIPASKVCNITTYDRSAELAGISEAHRQFMHPKINVSTSNAQSQGKNLKMSHFAIGENSVGHYTTKN